MIKKTLTKSEFKKNVLILMTGSAIAQAIPIAISPILTRIYSPKDFGLLALYMSICSIFVVFSSGRYDLALIEPKDDHEAKHLFIGSIILSALFCVFLLIFFVFFNSQITSLLGNEDISIWLYVVPLTVFALSCYSIFHHWLNRKKKFKDMSLNRIINHSSGSFIQCILGFLKFKSFGLIIGYTLGQLISIVILWKKIFKEKFNFNKKAIFITMKEYVRYPKYLIPATLAGTTAGEAPVILLTKFFDSSISGFFSLTTSVSAAPISLIGNAIGEVYRQRAAEEYQRHNNCKALFLKTFLLLFVIGLVPFAILFFFSVPLFTFVFGAEWAIAGRFAKYISFLIFFQLLSTPLSYTIVFNQSQKYDMVLQIGRTIFCILSITIGYYYSDYYLGVILYVISFSLYYVSHSILQYKSACGSVLRA